MANIDKSPAQADLHGAQISLLGEIDDEMVNTLREQLREAEGHRNDLTLEISTPGGDPEAARRMVLEIDLARERLQPRRLLFLGKTYVYSAGVTLMAAFPRENRFLAPDAILLIHGRQLERTLQISGPMRASRAEVQALLNEIDSGVELEEQNFQRLIATSDVTMEELLEKAGCNWYLSAREAWQRGLVAGIAGRASRVPPQEGAAYPVP